MGVVSCADTDAFHFCEHKAAVAGAVWYETCHTCDMYSILQ